MRHSSSSMQILNRLTPGLITPKTQEKQLMKIPDKAHKLMAVSKI